MQLMIETKSAINFNRKSDGEIKSAYIILKGQAFGPNHMGPLTKHKQLKCDSGEIKKR